MSQRILRRAEVEKLVGLRRSSIYAAIERGEFPRQLQISKRAVGWLEADILRWIEERVAKKESK